MTKNMRYRAFSFVAVLLLLIIMGISCTPKAGNGPQAQVPPVATLAPTLPSAPASLTPEDVAWNKVVEAAKKEGPLVIYTFSFTGDTGTAITQAIKKRHGITVEFISGRSPAVVERLRTEYRTNQVVASLAEGAGPRMMLLKEWGFTDSLRELPVLRDKQVWRGDILLYDNDASLLVHTLAIFTIATNTNLVKPQEEPRSWLDLLEPKWKGKLLTSDPVQDMQTYQLYVMMTNQKILTPDYFDKLARQELLFIMGGPADTGRALARGEAHIAVPGISSAAIPVIQAGGPMKLLTPKEGFAISATPFVFLKNAPQPNSAKYS